VARPARTGRGGLGGAQMALYRQASAKLINPSGVQYQIPYSQKRKATPSRFKVLHNHRAPRVRKFMQAQRLIVEDVLAVLAAAAGTAHPGVADLFVGALRVEQCLECAL